VTKSTAIAAARVAITVVLVAILVVIVWDRRGELLDLVEDPSWRLGAIFGLLVAGHFLNSTEFWLLYRAQGVTQLGMLENWMVFTSGHLGNLLPGQVGSIYKFRYMKVVHGVGYAKSGSNYGANLVVTIVSSAVVGISGLTISAAQGGDPSPVLFVVFGGLGLGALLLVAFPMPGLERLPGRVGNVWAGFREGWEELRVQPRVATTTLGLDVGKYALDALRLQLAFSLVGIHESLPYFLVLAPAAGMAGMLAITPGGIGFLEGFVAAAAVGLGSELETGLLGATVDRGVTLAFSLVLGSVGWWWTLRGMRAVAARDLAVSEAG